jgi:ribosomal protein S18 acetylase RimI-like enzyme
VDSILFFSARATTLRTWLGMFVHALRKSLYKFLTSAKGYMTVQITEFAEKHLPTIVRLLNDECNDSNEFIPFNEERVQSEIGNRRLKILVAEETGEVLGLVAAHSHENMEEHVSWLAATRGQGQKTIENMLVEELEKRVKTDAILIMIDEGSLKIADWTSRGYKLQPGFQRMSAKLDGLKPIPKVDEATKLRSLRTDEEEQFIEAVNKGFGSKRLERGDLEAWKLSDPPFTEEWVQVAEVKERIVSVVVAKPDTDAIKYLHLKRGYLGPGATLPEFRSRHLASALTARAMNFLFKKGMDSVILGTSEQNVSSIALLRSLGFKVENVRKIMRKELKNPRAPTK